MNSKRQETVGIGKEVCRMMRLITEYDVKMTKELAKWSVYPEDDTDIYLREDAPE